MTIGYDFMCSTLRGAPHPPGSCVLGCIGPDWDRVAHLDLSVHVDPTSTVGLTEVRGGSAGDFGGLLLHVRVRLRTIC